MDFDKFTFRQIDADTRIKSFDCGDADLNGFLISDAVNYYKSMMALTYLLEDNEADKTVAYYSLLNDKIVFDPDTPIRKIDISGDIKRQVANTVKMVGMRYKFQTLGEFNAILSLYNVRAEQTDGRVNGREYHGLVYFATDDSGNVVASPFKASRLGKFASRTAIDNRFVRAKDRIDVNPTRTIVADALAQSTNKSDFVARLKAARIDVLFRYTEEGRIYGVTFIDHNTMTVLNGSRLGKDYSANAFERRFNGEQTQPDMPVVIPVTDTHTPDADTTTSAPDGTSQTQNPTPQPAEHRSDNDMPELPGLDLFHVGPGYDAQEDAFYRAMRRKKKKGRSP